MAGQSFTVAAGTSPAYVHADERALVLCDSRHTVLFEQARRRWVAESLQILLDEGRATRVQGHHTFGGFVDGDQVTLYAFSGDSGVSLTLAAAQVAELRDALGR